MLKKWEVTLPGSDGAWEPVGDPMTRQEALDYARRHYGADGEGRVCLVNSLGEEDEASEFPDAYAVHDCGCKGDCTGTWTGPDTPEEE